MDSITYTRIKELCDKRKISVTKLESEVGMSQYSITRWKNANSPTVDKLLRVADYFNVSLDYLAGRSDTISSNIGIGGICAVTGLAEDSVNALSAMNVAGRKSLLHGLDALIQDEHLYDDTEGSCGCSTLRYIASYLFLDDGVRAENDNEDQRLSLSDKSLVSIPLKRLCLEAVFNQMVDSIKELRVRKFEDADIFGLTVLQERMKNHYGYDFEDLIYLIMEGDADHG